MKIIYGSACKKRGCSAGNNLAHDCDIKYVSGRNNARRNDTKEVSVISSLVMDSQLEEKGSLDKKIA